MRIIRPAAETVRVNVGYDCAACRLPVFLHTTALFTGPNTITIDRAHTHLAIRVHELQHEET